MLKEIAFVRAMGYTYALLVSYHGGPFAGWQYQEHAPSVQGLLQEALLHLTTETPHVWGAGRTDAGVHAQGQVAHVTLSRLWAPQQLCSAVNHWIRKIWLQYIQGYTYGAHKGGLTWIAQVPPVVVQQAARVAPIFHARFSALRRTYIYRIALCPYAHPLWPLSCWWLSCPLEVDLIAQGVKMFQGHHDFSNFRHPQCQSASPCKTMEMCSLKVEQHHNVTLLCLRFGARSFLHRQVRMMVGALVYVGRKKWTLGQMTDVLQCQQSFQGPAIAPPWGLTLHHVAYEEDLFQNNHELDT